MSLTSHEPRLVGSLVPCLPDADLWGKVRGEKGEISTGLMVGYLVGWCGEGYWCGGGGEFWGRGRLVESEVVQDILSYFGLPELDLVVDVSGRGERVIISWNPGWIHQNIEEDLFRSIP